jgi:hypothetical protein
LRGSGKSLRYIASLLTSDGHRLNPESVRRVLARETQVGQQPKKHRGTVGRTGSGARATGHRRASAADNGVNSSGQHGTAGKGPSPRL